MATLHIVRGLPGSGKSTFAKKLATQLGCKHFEADMFFTDENGNYNFDQERIGDAHEWCRDSVFDELAEGKDVIVSNTFTTQRELSVYLKDTFHIDVEELFSIGDSAIIYEMTGNYGNIHNVPVETLERMRKRWQPNVELNILITCGEIKWDSAVEFRTITP